MRIGKRLIIAGVLLLLFAPVVANGYTIVMRDGRRLEIPNNFEVGPSTLTYEAGPGIQVTLQLVTINIAATERANNESIGSLNRRSVRSRTEPAPKKSSGPGATVTNQDLERFKQARIASELAYEKRRKELGLPSVEESRNAALLAGERAQVQLLSMRSQEQQSENYWRSRASELRAELAATSERISIIQTRLNELPLNYSFGSVISVLPSFGSFSRVSPVLSIDQLARGAGFPKATFGNPNAFGRVHLGTRIGFGNDGFRGHVQMNSFPRPGFGRRQFPNRFPFGTVVALPFDAYDNSYERAALLSQLDQLLVQRAALQARWRELEDEARRSGAYPGWLR